MDTWAGNNSTPQDFVDAVESHQEMLFGDAARGMNLELTLYLPRANWWIYCQVLYEYGIQGEQVLSTPTTNFQTFRLNIYQTGGDIAYL